MDAASELDLKVDAIKKELMAEARKEMRANAIKNDRVVTDLSVKERKKPALTDSVKKALKSLKRAREHDDGAADVAIKKLKEKCQDDASEAGYETAPEDIA
ncbi:hypothetical protein ABW21_db0209909 [Orbilia brochopaga]|nr:hypothetical protein ABW21_db0209909 [Drechslerella brochopaga]